MFLDFRELRASPGNDDNNNNSEWRAHLVNTSFPVSERDGRARDSVPAGSQCSRIALVGVTRIASLPRVAPPARAFFHSFVFFFFFFLLLFYSFKIK
jgi:hypothetical protein